jgi:hypothetical protein
MDAMSRSRTKPVTRDARVSNETVEADLSRDTGCEVYALALAGARKQLVKRLQAIMAGFAGNILRP